MTVVAHLVTYRDGYRQSLLSHSSRESQLGPTRALVIYGQTGVGGQRGAQMHHLHVTDLF